MRRIVVDMQNFLFADAIAQTLRGSDSDLMYAGQKARIKRQSSAAFASLMRF